MSDNDAVDFSQPESDSNQLPREDTLLPDDGADPLDEGYIPPRAPRPGLYDETAADQAAGETLSRELAAEEPEVWDLPQSALDDSDTPRARVGRLIEDDEALNGRGNDIFADDGGVAGGRPSPEESALHIVTDED